MRALAQATGFTQRFLNLCVLSSNPTFSSPELRRQRLFERSLCTLSWQRQSLQYCHFIRFIEFNCITIDTTNKAFVDEGLTH